MSKSIVSRVAGGYATLGLLLVALLFVSALHFLVRDQGSREARALQGIQRPARRLLELAALRGASEQMRSARGELLRALQESEALPGGFFLPRSVSGRFEGLRADALRGLAAEGEAGVSAADAGEETPEDKTPEDKRVESLGPPIRRRSSWRRRRPRAGL